MYEKLKEDLQKMITSMARDEMIDAQGSISWDKAEELATNKYLDELDRAGLGIYDVIQFALWEEGYPSDGIGQNPFYKEYMAKKTQYDLAKAMGLPDLPSFFKGV